MQRWLTTASDGTIFHEIFLRESQKEKKKIGKRVYRFDLYPAMNSNFTLFVLSSKKFNRGLLFSAKQVSEFYPEEEAAGGKYFLQPQHQIVP